MRYIDDDMNYGGKKLIYSLDSYALSMFMWLIT